MIGAVGRRSWQNTAQDLTAGEGSFPDLCRKILLFIASDADALSAFKPMLEVLATCARELVVVTRSTGRLAEIEALGIRTIDFDDHRLSSNPANKAASVWQLARIIEAEEPEVVHLVGSRPIVMGGLALRLQRAPHVVLHVTGPGPLGVVSGRLSRMAHGAALRLVASMLREGGGYVLVENPTDLALLRNEGVDPGARFAILGGSGVDPQIFPALPPTANPAPVAAFVGSINTRNGVDVLFQACDRVAGRGLALSVELYGESDATDPDDFDAPALDAWAARSGGVWHDRVGDVRKVWRRADICVLPARHGGGMPRALLEAAACARPLLVTDVSGPRDFVRDGVEGLVVPPGDAAALADALQHLARDADLRERMGEAARLRLLRGYTHTHLREALRAAYQSLLGKKGAR
jgi:glycosyltransferase involved in cell wall biosynthesis